ncbi:putative lipoprotein [Flammeovirgaceae bacterium 311]|nr:putative lipoprotein [Flammeovirgaceae bacterium 311]
MRVISIKQVAIAVLSLSLYAACTTTKTEIWKLNRLELIGGHKTTVWGNPSIINTEEGGQAIEFDGIDDGLLLETNPLAGADRFTIEVIYKPYPGYPQNREQRFLHIQDPQNDNRRILMELRLNDRDQWYPDLFIRTDSASLTLIDSTKTFPVGAWARLRLIYQEGQLKGYVNGEEVLSGEIQYMPISPAAKTSIGVRMNQVSWFRGAIQSVSITNQALEPSP